MPFRGWNHDLPTPCPLSSQKLRKQPQLASKKKRNKSERYTVLFLTAKVTNSQRSRVLAQLSDPEPVNSWPERPKGLYARPVKAAKWIRNWTPGKGNAPSLENCIERMVRASLAVSSSDSMAGECRIVSGGKPFGKRGGYGMILIDEDSLRGLDTEKGAEVVMVTWIEALKSEGFSRLNPSKDEIQLFAARVPIRRANLLLSFAYESPTEQSFEEIVPNITTLDIDAPGNAMLIQSNDDNSDNNTSLPNHSTIPRMTKDKIGVMSLVHLTDKEIEGLITTISKTSDELKEEGTARSENSRKQSQNSKEEEEEEETHKEVESQDKDVESLPIEIHQWPAEGEPCSRAELYKIFQAVRPSFFPDRRSKSALFVDVPDPSKDLRNKPELLLVVQHWPIRGIRLEYEDEISIFRWREDESVTELWPFICESISPKDLATPKNRPWWETNSFEAFELVPNPLKPTWHEEALPCFILIDLPETELRKMKSVILEQHDSASWGTLEFIEVGVSLSSPDIKGLMQWFEECMIDGYQPPGEFLALDQQSFDYYANNQGDEDGAMILGSSESLHTRHNEAGVTDVIGFGFGRLSTEYAISGCVSLQVVNMSFVDEIVRSEKITYLYWSDILEAERLDPGDDMSLSDQEYKEEDQVFTAQPQDMIE